MIMNDIENLIFLIIQYKWKCITFLRVILIELFWYISNQDNCDISTAAVIWNAVQERGETGQLYEFCMKQETA